MRRLHESCAARMCALLLVLSFSRVGQSFAAPVQHPAYSLMVAAARNVARAESLLCARTQAMGLYDSSLDPACTGVIGAEYSPITTTLGSLSAKRTAANPDFAAYVVRELIDHSIGAGDSALVTMSGSFPGLNLAVLTALETVGVRSLCIASLGASSYGANQVEFTWLDMEDCLVREGFLKRRTDFVTLGGTGDVGGGISDEGKEILRRKAEALGYAVLQSRSLRKQSALRRETVGSPQDYALLINIGGNQAVLGRGPQGRELHGGWNDSLPEESEVDSSDQVDGIIFDFLQAKVPVLNFLHIESIAESAGLAVDPSENPTPGESPVYFLAAPSPR